MKLSRVANEQLVAHQCLHVAAHLEKVHLIKREEKSINQSIYITGYPLPNTEQSHLLGGGTILDHVISPCQWFS